MQFLSNLFDPFERVWSLNHNGKTLSILYVMCSVVCIFEVACQSPDSLEPQIASSSYDSSRPELISKRLEIQGGQVDESRTHVVGMVIQQGWSGGACSGTLIAPNLVLTAQHCIAPTSSQGVMCGASSFGSPFDLDEVYVTTRTEFPRFGYYEIAEISLPDEQSDFCGRDIALLLLRQNVPADEATPTAPRVDEPVSVGERFSAVGYGHTGNGQGAGVRRSIANRRVVCTGFQNGCQDNNQGIYVNEWVGDDGTCQGDSGGPALDSEERVIGVLSRGPEGCIYPVYTDVIRYAPWIRSFAERAAMLGGYEPEAWVTTLSGAGADDDEDLIVDRYDNCPEASNPSQQDFDRDGIGDLCDPLISGDRGGRCPVCNQCTRDEECGGQGGVCLTLPGGGVCTYPCRGGFECPETTDCIEIEDQQSYCFNNDIYFSGPCPSNFQCGGPSESPNVPVDDGACHVCESCQRSEDCASGVCASLGGGPQVCTRSCEVDSDCRMGSVCMDDQGRKLCVNAEYQAEGICPDGFVCAPPMTEPAGTEMMAGVEGVDPPLAGQDGGEIAGELPSEPEVANPDLSGEERVSKPEDEGCQARPHQSGLGHLLIALLFMLFGVRVRARNRGYFY